jgi:hypothetical protein
MSLEDNIYTERNGAAPGAGKRQALSQGSS